jgi:predicted Zn-dependent protease
MQHRAAVTGATPMKSLSKSITTANRLFSNFEDRYLFNASEVHDLLLQLKELREYPINMTEIFDGGLQFNIGHSIYQREFCIFLYYKLISNIKTL